MKQSSKDRIERLNKGCCPVHGMSMSQIDVWYEPSEGEPYTIVGCPRQACLIFAKAYSFNGPWKLPEQFKMLLDDSSPDPKYIDENVKPNKQKKSLKKFKHLVWNKTHGICYYCGIKLSLNEMTIDHLIAKEKGGTDKLDNLFPACKFCNSSKGTKSLEEFRFFIAMRLFDQKHNISFSQEQIAFLEARGFNVDIPKYKFWFERKKNKKQL